MFDLLRNTSKYFERGNIRHQTLIFFWVELRFFNLLNFYRVDQRYPTTIALAEKNKNPHDFLKS